MTIKKMAKAPLTEFLRQVYDSTVEIHHHFFSLALSSRFVWWFDWTRLRCRQQEEIKARFFFLLVVIIIVCITNLLHHSRHLPLPTIITSSIWKCSWVFIMLLLFLFTFVSFLLFVSFQDTRWLWCCCNGARSSFLMQHAGSTVHTIIRFVKYFAVAAAPRVPQSVAKAQQLTVATSSQFSRCYRADAIARLSTCKLQ